VTPGIALAIIIYIVDRHDREPIGLLLKTFIGGAVIVVPTIFLESILAGLNPFVGLMSVAYTSFIVAGFTEEMFKRSVVMRLAFDHPAFDEKLDGIVYCVMASLGFATVENVMYVVFRFADVETVGLYRAILSVPAHMLFGITMGYYLSLAKFCTNPAKRRTFYGKSLTMPMILHGTFNFILLSGDGFLMLIFLPYVFYLWRTNLKKLNKYYQESKMINTGIYDGELDESECE